MFETFIDNMFESVSLYDMILFIVSGYVFTNVFRFVIEAERRVTDLQSIMLYMIVGFVLNNICATVPFRTSKQTVNIVIYICVCIFVAYIIGILYMSKPFQWCLRKLKIRNSAKSSIWSAITNHEESLWVLVGYKSLDIKYYGILGGFDSGETHPQIALYGYSKGGFNQDLKKSPSEDYTGDLSKFVLLDTSKADIIEFTSTNEIRKQKRKTQKEKKT